MTQIDTKTFKNAGFSFEEIESLRKSEEEINNGNFITQEEMDHFIKNELFSKYMAENV